MALSDNSRLAIILRARHEGPVLLLLYETNLQHLGDGCLGVLGFLGLLLSLAELLLKLGYPLELGLL